MADSLFTSQTPTVSDATDGVAYSLGTKFWSTVAGSITHGRWYFPGTAPSSAVDFVLYDATTHAQLARATFASGSAGWRTVALPSPVSYPTPLVALIAVVETPNRYVATTNFFASPLTSGSLVSPGDGDNGRLSTGATYPTGSFSDSCYFVDVVFVPTGTGQSAAAGTATETDSAPALGRQKRRTSNLPTETDTAPALARRKRRTIGVAGEVDQAVPLVVPDVGVGSGPRYTTTTGYGRYATSTSARYTTTTQRGRT